ncbi:MAG: hypothetical protein ACJAT2_001628 [Bacteriovoracaceae bacterium]
MKLLIISLFFISLNSNANSCGLNSFTSSLKRALGLGESRSSIRKQKISPKAAKAKFDAAKSIEDLPVVNEKKLEVIEKFRPTTGTNENYFYRGDYKGRKVFIKTLDDEVDKFSPSLMFNEARHYHLMDLLGVGPKFHGTTVIDGKVGVVLEHVEGVLVKWGSNPGLRQAGITIKPSAISDMKLTAKRLDEAGIHNPKDMQFIISPDGTKATLVDPEHFKSNGPSNGAEEELSKMLETLKGYFAD